MIEVAAYGCSDIGNVRQNNEDAWGQIPELRFYVLADGMGGHQAGEVASQMAIDELCSIVQEEWKPLQCTLMQGKEFLTQAIQHVNLLVFNYSQTNVHFKGMGTTICALLFHPQGIICAHIGDSRIYRFRNYYLEQLTQDHSWFKEHKMASMNGHAAYRHVLSKALGTEAIVEPSVTVSPVLPDDVFLICSDGLTDMLVNDDIQNILREYSADEATVHLIQEAKNRGGLDNITVMIVRTYETNLPR